MNQVKAKGRLTQYCIELKFLNYLPIFFSKNLIKKKKNKVVENKIKTCKFHFQ